MANFPPLKKHLLYCIDRMTESHPVSGPFLDAGCGSGDVSLHLARKNWTGRAIDMSEDAVENALSLMAAHPSVRVENESLFEQTGKFNAVFAMDVIEHLDNDVAALEKIASLLPPGGHLILSVPSNPREWRWDDDVFGHVRRYTAGELSEKLNNAGFSPVEMWDFTFPVFWLMRRAYTRLKPKPTDGIEKSSMERTIKSSGLNPWEIPVLSGLLSRENPFWRFVSRWQFRHFRHRLDNGHEIILLARKN
jgi:SAM-dependent methyltransferase